MSKKIEILENVPVHQNMEFYMDLTVSETLSNLNEDSGMDRDVSMGSSLAHQGDRRFTHYKNLDKCIMKVKDKTTTKAAAAVSHKSAKISLKNLEGWLMTTEIFRKREDRLRAIIDRPEQWWNSDETAMWLRKLSRRNS